MYVMYSPSLQFSLNYSHYIATFKVVDSRFKIQEHCTGPTSKIYWTSIRSIVIIGSLYIYPFTSELITLLIKCPTVEFNVDNFITAVCVREGGALDQKSSFEEESQQPEYPQTTEP